MNLEAELTAQRASAVEQLAALSAGLDSLLSATDSVATDDEHDPEGVTIAVERAQLIGLLGSTRARVEAIDTALARLAAGDYGRCTECGHDIAAERLAARPVATTCISCAR